MPDFAITVPSVVKNLSLFGAKSTDINVQDVRALQRRLKAIEPDLRKMLIREAKGVGREAESAIKRAIPKTSPLRASNSRGRLAWDRQQDRNNRILAPDKTRVEFRTSTGNRSGRTSLVRVRVEAPMTVIADIAGRSGRAIGRGYKGSGYSRSFVRNGAVIRMRLNGQGEGMIRKLGTGASRYAWPAIINDKPRLEAEVKKVLQKYEAIANRGYN